MIRALPTVTLEGTEYFVDERLGEIRAVRAPHDSESVSPDLIAFWKGQGWLKEDSL